MVTQIETIIHTISVLGTIEIVVDEHLFIKKFRINGFNDVESRF